MTARLTFVRRACAKAWQPVGELRQRVVVGVILELLLGGLALGDVPVVEDDRRHARIGEHVLPEAFQPHPLAVAVTESQFPLSFRDLAFE
jgi:hypothetical protein